MSYKIMQKGIEIGVSPTIVHIYLGKNGAYQECEKESADGFCVKLPHISSIADGEMNDELDQNGVCDTVFSFQGHNLPGACGEATYIELSENRQ